MDKNKYYCRINGVIHNLKDVQNVMDGIDTENKIGYVLMDNHGFDPLDAMLAEEVIEFNNNEIPADYNEALERLRAYNSRNHPKVSNQPKCPTCQSTNIRKISATSKVAGAIGFGLFSKTARSQFECKSCKYKW